MSTAGFFSEKCKYVYSSTFTFLVFAERKENIIYKLKKLSKMIFQYSWKKKIILLRLYSAIRVKNAQRVSDLNAAIPTDLIKLSNQIHSGHLSMR